MSFGSWMWDMVPFVAMVSVECTDVGVSTVSKAALAVGMSRYVSIVYYNALATLILLPYLIFQRKKRGPLTFSLICKFFLLALIGSTGQILFLTGINLSSPTLSSAMANLSPVFTFLLAVIFRMETLEVRRSSSQAKCLGAIVAVTGALIVTLYRGPVMLKSSPDSNSLDHQQPLFSDKSDWILGGFVLSFVMLLSATWNIAQGATVKEYPEEMTIVFFFTFFVTIQSAAFALILERNPNGWKLNHGIEVIAIVFTAIFGSLFRISVHTWCLRTKGPVFVAMFKPLGIAIAGFMAVMFLGDSLHLGSVIGSIIIAVGFYSVMWGEIKGKDTMVLLNDEACSSGSSSQKTPLLVPRNGGGNEALQQNRPDFIVADTLFPWATDAGAKFGIPRVVFHGTCCFSLCVRDHLKLYEPHKSVSAADEQFLVPNLPGKIRITRNQIFNIQSEDDGSDQSGIFKECLEADSKRSGVVVNSFYELESVYADNYRNRLGRKAWHIGPCSLLNKGSDAAAAAIDDEHECLRWLDSKKPNSVVYVCFGSIVSFPPAQLKEIALGLEASGQDFICKQEYQSDWLPSGFEERIGRKGLIVRGWAPQLLILDHEAVGGLVTHCGWNSTLEGIAAGLPMVTWPVIAEQFFNEVLVTQVLRIGVSCGVRCCMDFVESEAIKDAVTRIMAGGEAEEMGWRAKELKGVARKAVEEGGSSHSDFNALIEEIRAHCH